MVASSACSSCASSSSPASSLSSSAPSSPSWSSLRGRRLRESTYIFKRLFSMLCCACARVCFCFYAQDIPTSRLSTVSSASTRCLEGPRCMFIACMHWLVRRQGCPTYLRQSLQRRSCIPVEQRREDTGGSASIHRAHSRPEGAADSCPFAPLRSCGFMAHSRSVGSAESC